MTVSPGCVGGGHLRRSQRHEKRLENLIRGQNGLSSRGIDLEEACFGLGVPCGTGTNSVSLRNCYLHLSMGKCLIIRLQIA